MFNSFIAHLPLKTIGMHAMVFWSHANANGISWPSFKMKNAWSNDNNLMSENVFRVLVKLKSFVVHFCV